jgi:hypothetical protein
MLESSGTLIRVAAAAEGTPAARGGATIAAGGGVAAAESAAGGDVSAGVDNSGGGVGAGGDWGWRGPQAANAIASVATPSAALDPLLKEWLGMSSSS